MLYISFQSYITLLSLGYDILRKNKKHFSENLRHLQLTLHHKTPKYVQAYFVM
jgi:hypothetical protein